MIGQGMPVQIRRCGTSVLVERLSIGDVLYDPLADNYVEIVDILSRDSTRLGDQLARIRAGQFGRDCPRQDVILSRHQPVAYPDRAHGSGPYRLEFGAAHQLGEELRMKTNLFALFPERRGCICVGGAVLQLNALAMSADALAQGGGMR